MLYFLMFLCVWIATAKDMFSAKFMRPAFVVFIFYSFIFKVQKEILISAAVIFGLLGLCALLCPWKKYPGGWDLNRRDKWIKHPAEFLALWCFSGIFRIVPLPIMSAVVGKLLEKFGRHTKRNDIIVKNLQLVMPENNNRKFINKCWRNWGRVYAEGFYTRTYARRFKKYIKFKGVEYVEQAKKLKSGFLISVAHYGYMGLGAFAAVKLVPDKKLGITYRFPKNPLSLSLLTENYGTKIGGRISYIPIGDAFGMVRILSGGGMLDINFDHHIKRENGGVELSFFGHPVVMADGVARLAKKFGIPVLMGIVHRTHGCHHEIIFSDLVDIPKNLDERQGQQMLNDKMEAMIRQDPSQYLWMHRLWSSRLWKS